MKPVRGKFITLEGTEGVGKTTNLEYIHQKLLDAGKQVVVTREPGGTTLGEDIRNLLLGHKHDGMSSDTELLLMFAARAEHLHKIIGPALETGKWVLCDRFTDATYAYQGGGRGIEDERIAAMEDWVQGGLRPDMTILLDIPVEQGLKRAGERSGPDRFEKEQIEFFEKVRACYLKMAKQHPQRYNIIDASPELDAVQKQIDAALAPYLEKQA